MLKTDAGLNDWHHFDKIYCISTEERADRRTDAEIQFGKVGLRDRVEFVIVKKHPDNPEAGIFEAHMACMKRGIRANAASMVIFEDDILFERFSSAALKNCIQFLSSNLQWDALFFGCLVSGSRKTKYKSVRSVKYRTLAHAYIVNRHFAERLVKTPWHGVAFDDLLRQHQEGLFGVYPSFAFQSNSPSDNHRHLRLDKFRRLCGGLRRIQKMNEWYHCHKMPFIALHMLLALLIMWWIF